MAGAPGRRVTSSRAGSRAYNSTLTRALRDAAEEVALQVVEDDRIVFEALDLAVVQSGALVTAGLPPALQLHQHALERVANLAEHDRVEPVAEGAELRRAERDTQRDDPLASNSRHCASVTVSSIGAGLTFLTHRAAPARAAAVAQNQWSYATLLLRRAYCMAILYEFSGARKKDFSRGGALLRTPASG